MPSIHSAASNEDLANRLTSLAASLIFEAAQLVEHNGVGLVAGGAAIKAQALWIKERGSAGQDDVKELEPGLNRDGVTTRVGTYLTPNYFGNQV